MKVATKVLIRLSVGMGFFMLWFYKMLVTSDVPVFITYDEMISVALALVISTILALLFTKKASDAKLLYFVAIPAMLWGISLVQSLIHHYHTYDTILSVVGFVGCLSIMLVSFFKK